MKCPFCNETMLEYVYGFPTSKLLERADAGEILLGGCGVYEYNPTHYCSHCQEQYPSADEIEYQSY